MTASRMLLSVLLVLAVASCQDHAVVTENQPNPQRPNLAVGGIPGRPFDIVPTPPGLTRLPKPLPPKARPPSFLSSIVDVDAGNLFSCALRSDGLAYCWGAGMLGDGSAVGSSTPVEVAGPTRYVRLEAGDANACGLTATGEAWCWGDNSQGQLGAGLSAPFALVPVPVAGGHRFTDLDVGLRSMCGVATTGTTYCWGSNQSGQLGIGSISASVNVPTAVVNSAALGFVSVDNGFLHTCALTGTGQIYCWGSSSGFGNGSTGPIIPSPTLSAGGGTFTSISVGNFYSCGLAATGAARCWGYTQFSGELGTGSTTDAALSPLAVVGGLSFGSLDAFDNNIFVASTCGLANSGAAWCWGSNAVGQLGAPAGATTCTFAPMTYPCSPVPVPVSGGLTFRDIAVGGQHACALEPAGTVWCWGGNNGGQLGDGTMVNSSTPVQVLGLKAPQQDGWIEVTPTAALIRLIGLTQRYTAVARDENGVSRAVQPTFTWTSSNPAAATIDATGLATAVATGTTTLTATAPDGTSGRAALDVQIVDPVALFRDAWAGGSSAGLGASDGVVILGGLLADEWVHSGTFLTRHDIDRRTIAADNVTVEATFARLAFARSVLEYDAARLRALNTADPTVGQLLALAGYTYIAFAENFCSGVPLDDPNIGASTSALFNLALTRFGEALAGPIAAPFDNVARVGTARAQLGLGNFSAAAAAAALVPSGFVFGTTHSATVGQQNLVWALSPQGKTLSVADNEGANGDWFRSNADPRVLWEAAGLGFDAVTPSYILKKYPDATAPIIVASGTEAQLIGAEAMLNAGDPAAMSEVIRRLRASVGLLGLAMPQTAAGQQDQLFSERAFWMFATGQRLGDLRRLIAHYGRTAGSVLPVGGYHKGGSYGTDANLPVPTSARGPSYAGCTNRES